MARLLFKDDQTYQTLYSNKHNESIEKKEEYLSIPLDYNPFTKQKLGKKDKLAKPKNKKHQEKENLIALNQELDQEKEAKVDPPKEKKSKKHLNRFKRDAIAGYLYILPWIVGFILFGVYQLFSSFRMSFAESATYVINAEKGVSVFTMRGFSLVQYIDIFKNNPAHLDVIISTLTDVAIVVPLVVIFALVLALLLKSPIKGRGVFRTIFFIPVILLSGNLLSYFTQYGLLTMPGVASGKIQTMINSYLPEAVGNVISFAFGKIILILWLSGVQTIIFLAGLNKIDKSVYEAASIEGASGWDSFWKITLPAISGLIIINVIYTTVVYCNLSNNGIVSLISSTMLLAQYGRDYASALSWILFLIELLIIGVYSLIIKLIFRQRRREG